MKLSRCVKSFYEERPSRFPRTFRLIWLSNEVAIKLCQEEFRKNLKEIRQRYYRLDVRIDDRGVVRSVGCLDKSNLSDEIKRPITVPGQHLLVHVMAEHYHKKFRHQGYRVVTANLRQEGILVVGGKKLLKFVAACCLLCRMRRRKLFKQRMGALPSFRVQPRLAPCTSVAVDFLVILELNCRGIPR